MGLFYYDVAGKISNSVSVSVAGVIKEMQREKNDWLTHVTVRADKHYACSRIRTVKFTSAISQHPQFSYCTFQGRRHGFESGGGNFASGASQKNFLTPPTFWPMGGDKILLR